MTTPQDTKAGALVRSLLEKSLSNPIPSISETQLKEAVALYTVSKGASFDYGKAVHTLATFLATGGDLEKQANVTEAQIASFFTAAKKIIDEVGTGTFESTVSEQFKPSGGAENFTNLVTPGTHSAKYQADENQAGYGKPAKTIKDPKGGYVDTSDISYSAEGHSGGFNPNPTAHLPTEATHPIGTYEKPTRLISGNGYEMPSLTSKALAKMISSNPQEDLAAHEKSTGIEARGDYMQDPVEVANLVTLAKIIGSNKDTEVIKDRIQTAQIKKTRDTDLTKAR